MYLSASATVTSISLERENAPIPYTMPKFTAFAARRISEVIMSAGISNTCAAVEV